jgi:hypothetical protein
MVITDDFVMLNYPKTGSSFARTIISTAYAIRRNFGHDVLVKLKLREPAFQEIFMQHAFLDTVDQHGNVRQIPQRFRNRKVISITRDPVDRYLSQYHYRWWAKNPPADVNLIREHYSSFPDISFEQFFEMMNTFGKKRRVGIIPVDESLGVQTVQFVQFFFKNPEEALTRINRHYISGEDYLEDMAEVHFIHQDDLGNELKDFLIQYAGFSPADLSFIDDVEKINVSEKVVQTVPDYLLEKIKDREALLYRIFPEFSGQVAPT